MCFDNQNFKSPWNLDPIISIPVSRKCIKSLSKKKKKTSLKSLKSSKSWKTLFHRLIIFDDIRSGHPSKINLFSICRRSFDTHCVWVFLYSFFFFVDLYDSEKFWELIHLLLPPKNLRNFPIKFIELNNKKKSLNEWICDLYRKESNLQKKNLKNW